ncbi:hypothetical protein FGB62_24g129 [Gracilaria domingensis]|nr:hypothetical protein FGB62_24g129 [Gracilaria domingensis]
MGFLPSSPRWQLMRAFETGLQANYAAAADQKQSSSLLPRRRSRRSERQAARRAPPDEASGKAREFFMCACVRTKSPRSPVGPSVISPVVNTDRLPRSPARASHRIQSKHTASVHQHVSFLQDDFIEFSCEARTHQDSSAVWKPLSFRDLVPFMAK